MKNLSGPPYTLACNGSFGAEGDWIITLVIRYSGKVREGSPSANAAQAEALRILVHERDRGRSLGATGARVFFDLGDGIVKELWPEGVMWRFAENEPPETFVAPSDD